MTELAFNFTQRATTVEIDISITIEGKLHVCLMQIDSALDAITADAARPSAVAAMRHLLVGGDGHTAPVLGEMIPGAEPVLIVLPEFALGSGDWAPVDAAIRATPRPVIVIAGFGATPGKIVLDWSAAEIEPGQTIRHLAWDQRNDQIGGVRPVNGGWCWIHVPGDETHCLAFLKNVSEQDQEAVVLADLQFGRTITHLHFNDVDLFPLICADLLQPIAEHPDSAQARVREALAQVDAGRPVMVIGSLLQHGYNVNWERAVDSLLTNVMAGRRSLVTLCNIAFDKPVADEIEDRWRSLTGVFGKWDVLTKGQKNLKCGRRLNATGIVGAVIRRSTPTVTSGTVDWGPYGPIDGKFVWHAQMLCPAGPQGLVAPLVRPPTQHACEVARFMRRHPADDGWSPRIAHGMAVIAAHFADDRKPSAERLLDTILGGVNAAPADPDALHEQQIVPAAVTGLHSLATIITIDGVEWQPIDGQSGQVRQPECNRNILVWRDPVKTAAQMRSELGAWCLEAGEHPDLIVLGGSRFGDMVEGVISEARRDDVSVAPPASVDLAATGSLAPDGVDITMPRSRRKVAAIGLPRVATIYADYQEDVDDAASVQALLDRINSYFPREAAA